MTLKKLIITIVIIGLLAATPTAIFAVKNNSESYALISSMIFVLVCAAGASLFGFYTPKEP